MGFLLAALDFKGEDGSAAVGEVFLIEGVVRVVRQRRVVHMLYLGVSRKVFHHFLRVLRMALQA